MEVKKIKINDKNFQPGKSDPSCIFETYLTTIHTGVIFFTATFDLQLEKFLFFGNIIKTLCENFKWFKETFTLAPTDFLKTTPMQNL